jgi:hypothetical protein
MRHFVASASPGPSIGPIAPLSHSVSANTETGAFHRGHEASAGLATGADAGEDSGA